MEYRHTVDGEFNEYTIGFLDNVQVFLFGCVTYEYMAGCMPTEQAKTDEPLIAGKMNELQKVIV